MPAAIKLTAQPKNGNSSVMAACIPLVASIAAPAVPTVTTNRMMTIVSKEVNPQQRPGVEAYIAGKQALSAMVSGTPPTTEKRAPQPSAFVVDTACSALHANNRDDITFVRKVIAEHENTGAAAEVNASLAAAGATSSKPSTVAVPKVSSVMTPETFHEFMANNTGAAIDKLTVAHEAMISFQEMNKTFVATGERLGKLKSQAANLASQQTAIVAELTVKSTEFENAANAAVTGAADEEKDVVREAANSLRQQVPTSREGVRPELLPCVEIAGQLQTLSMRNAQVATELAALNQAVSQTQQEYQNEQSQLFTITEQFQNALQQVAESQAKTEGHRRA